MSQNKIMFSANKLVYIYNLSEEERSMKKKISHDTLFTYRLNNIYKRKYKFYYELYVDPYYKL